VADGRGGDRPIDLVVSHYMPRDHGTHRDFIAPWARAVEAVSGGRLRLTVHDGDSALGRLERQHEQVVSGVVDVAHSVASLPPGRFPRTAIAGAPFLAASASTGTRVLARLFSRFLAVEYTDLTVLALHADSGGLLHTREGPIERLDDLRDLRIRAPSALVASALAELGAVPVVLAPLQIRAAAEAGQLDGAAMAWDVLLYSDTAAIFRYHLDVPLYVSPLYFVMNRARYAGLDPARRGAIDAASGPALAERFGHWWEAWSGPAREEVRRRGNRVSGLAPGERERWAGAAQPAVDRWLRGLEADGVAEARAIHEAASALAGA
jgi:TRAP-type C4-dicarboxylate transport system substrate-binding protein